MKKQLIFGMLLVIFLTSCTHKANIEKDQLGEEDAVLEGNASVPVSVPACDVPLGEIVSFLDDFAKDNPNHPVVLSIAYWEEHEDVIYVEFLVEDEATFYDDLQNQMISSFREYVIDCDSLFIFGPSVHLSNEAEVFEILD